MTDIVIKKHNFDLAKKRLKEFSEKTESDLKLKRVDTRAGFFGIRSHKVTGSEFNDRLETIQKQFMIVNDTNNKVIREFKEVYNALDELDKGYISSIVANVKALEKTSNDVRIQQDVLSQHNSELQKQQRELDMHQIEINKMVDNMKKTINVLKLFKNKLENLKHLADIDKIWNDYNSLNNAIDVISDSVSMSSKIANENYQENADKIEILKEKLTSNEIEINDIGKIVHSLEEKFDFISKFVASLKKIEHIQDIDEMWQALFLLRKRIHDINNKLNSIQKIMDKNQENIDNLLSFMKKVLMLEHLMDIDTMWKSIEKHTLQIDENEKKGMEIFTIVQNNKNDIEQKFENMEKEMKVEIELLRKQIKYAYLIIGGVAGVAIIELILIFMKVF